ncbi:hypothetical protein [Methylobacterium gregans]
MTKLDAKTLKAVTGGTSKCEPTPGLPARQGLRRQVQEVLI